MPTGQAIVKPEDLRRFASELRQFSEHLKADGTRLRGQFQRVGETWRDQEHQRFAKEFDKNKSDLEKMLSDLASWIRQTLKEYERICILGL